MYQNQLFFEDFQKVFKAKLSSEASAEKVVTTTPAKSYRLEFRLRKLLVRFSLQYKLG